MPKANPKRQRIYARAARILELAQRDVERRRARGELPPMNMGLPAPQSAEERREWGLRLRQRREQVGLTRIQLAQLSGVADSTIRNLETGRHKPTRSIVMRLQAVPALGMPSPFAISPLEQQSEGARSGESGFSCNCWFAPEYDSIKLARDMVQRLNGTGGNLEQTYMYIEPASAAAWCAISEQDAWARAKALVPMRDIARGLREAAAAEASGPQPLDVIGLGSGEAIDEVRLVQNLLDEQFENMRLFLLEISQPLLCAGYKYAAQVLGDLPNVDVYAIQGNFHNLPSYTQLFDAPQRRRLACLFGCTFSNLENEILFLRNSLCGFTEGDLLLIDVPMAFGSPANPEEIMKKDPRLSRPLPYGNKTIESRQYEWLEGPFRRHVKGLRSIQMRPMLDLQACPVPGSYAVEWRGTVTVESGPPREFSAHHVKRYDPELLDEFMAQNGWQPLKQWRYAEEYHPRVIALYKKRGSAGLQGGLPDGRKPGDAGGQAKAL